MPTVIEKSGTNTGVESASPMDPDKGHAGKRKKKCRQFEWRVDRWFKMLKRMAPDKP